MKRIISILLLLLCGNFIFAQSESDLYFMKKFVPQDVLKNILPARQNSSLHPKKNISTDASDFDRKYFNAKGFFPYSHYKNHAERGNNPVVNVPPANDGICGAIALSNTDCFPRNVANWTEGDGYYATWEAAPAAPACWGANYLGRTVWYKFTATTTAQHITTDWYDYVYDTQIAVYGSSNNLCSGVLTLIGCNDDDWYAAGTLCDNYDDYCGTGEYFSDITVTGLTVGNTYFIRVDGYNWDFFNGYYGDYFVICTQPAPTNDACSTVKTVALNTVYASTNEGASGISNNNVTDEAFSCGSTENSLWYKFSPVATDNYYINQWAQSCVYNLGTQFIVYKAGYNCATIPKATGASNSATEFVCSAASTGSRYITLALTAGQTYYFVVDGVAGDECSFNLEITQASPMPVQLINFFAICKSAGIEIKWSTASEVNNDYFVVEKSFDGIDFSLLGTVTGAGNSSTERDYSIIDGDYHSGISYYRLKQVDYNGATEVFNTIFANCSEENIFSLSVNNPSDGNEILLSIAGAKEAIIKIVDMLGREVYAKNIFVDSNHLVIITPNLSSGIYVISALSEGRLLSEKLLVR